MHNSSSIGLILWSMVIAAQAGTMTSRPTQYPSRRDVSCQRKLNQNGIKPSQNKAAINHTGNCKSGQLKSAKQHNAVSSGNAQRPSFPALISPAHSHAAMAATIPNASGGYGVGSQNNTPRQPPANSNAVIIRVLSIVCRRRSQDSGQLFAGAPKAPLTIAIRIDRCIKRSVVKLRP